MEQAGPVPFPPPMGGRRYRHMYNRSRLAEKKHNRFLARGRDKATCMGESKGGAAPLLLPQELPLWPGEDLAVAEAQLGGL